MDKLPHSKLSDYQALAEFRYQVRRYLHVSEQAAREAGTEPQHHQLLLAVKGAPDGHAPRIAYLAERLQIQHHSAVELVDRMEKKGLITRVRGESDRREVLVQLTAEGNRLLAELTQQMRVELRSAAPTLLSALHKLAVRYSEDKLGQEAAESECGMSANKHTETLCVDGLNPLHPDQPSGLLGQEARFRTGLVSLLAAVIGMLAGIIAYLLYNLIGLFTNIAFYHHLSFAFRSPRENHLGLLVIVTPVIGGIIVGIMARYGSDKIRGHGIPEAMEAVLINRSRIEPKVAILKPISAAIAIGTGGPFGAEGPIIQTGGAIGSLVGQLMHATAAERKVLLACGAAAGMAATFSTPIAGVILAIELLLFEFKSRSFIPLVIASTLATSVHFRLMGPGPMFQVGTLDFGLPHALPFYLVLGVLCGLAALGFSKTLYWVEDQFEKLPIHNMWWPAIGALGLGIIGYFVPRVLGVGYDTISDILNARMLLGGLLAVMIFKSAALVISLGSGTSGGLLAPMFMASAAMGSVFAMVVDKIWPAANLSPGAFALVAMGAVFGAASRAAFTFIIFAFEITRDYNSVLPLMLVTVIADAIAVGYAKNSIMTEKLARRGLHIHQDYEPDVLQQVTVGETMAKDFDVVPSTMRVAELAERITKHDPSVTHHQGVFIVNPEGRLAAIITRADIMRALEKDPSGNMSVFEAGSPNPIVTYPSEVLYDAAAKMLRSNVGRLPVASWEDPGKPVGYLGRSQIMAARLRRLEEEFVREPGWMKGRKPKPVAG